MPLPTGRHRRWGPGLSTCLGDFGKAMPWVPRSRYLDSNPSLSLLLVHPASLPWVRAPGSPCSVTTSGHTSPGSWRSSARPTGHSGEWAGSARAHWTLRRGHQENISGTGAPQSMPGTHRPHAVSSYSQTARPPGTLAPRPQRPRVDLPEAICTCLRPQDSDPGTKGGVAFPAHVKIRNTF